VAEEAGPGGGGSSQAEIRTFLIADVRGYTLFTQERGDEVAAKLAKKFAELAREGVEGRGGSVIELRGDEALAVFTSPRQAIRAAVDLQQRFVDETLDDPSLPLMVGIGLDAGEAVQVEGGYRGGALNMAARLCGQAGPGEILATPEVVHLARAVEGVKYVDRGALHLKGMAQAVRVTRVVPEERDPRAALAPLVEERKQAARRPARFRSWKWIAAAATVVVAIAVIAPLTLSGGGGATLAGIGANSVGLIDLKTHRLTGQVSVGARPVSIAAGAGAIWVADSGDNTVARIDPTSHAVQMIPVGSGPVGVAVGLGFVWVTNSGERTVSQISPKTNAVVQTIPVGNGPTGVAVGKGAVWVTESTDATLRQIDPNSDKVVRTIGVGQDPVAVSVAQDVWVANAGDGTVSEVDPASGHVVQTVFVGSGPTSVVATSDAVWTANSLDGTVSRIDPSTGTIAQTVPVGDGPSGLASTASGLWVANQFDGSVSLIAPRTGNPITTSVGEAPQAVVATGSSLWVAASGAGISHRGGTITVAAHALYFDSFDPAVAYTPESWGIVIDTNDGLVAFDKVDGPTGSTIVPDLAVAVPRPTNGGTTYTFQLRPGIRYSTGQVVQPSDFLRAVERVLRIGKAPPLYGGIVGASACSKTRCDLSRGIVADDHDRTVTIHLVAPDPELLYKLALPFADPVPPGTPWRQVHTPVPATGPYMIGTYRPLKGKVAGTIVLVRNPKFREWSPAAQPQGYPDRIVWQLGLPNDEPLVTAVEQGSADYMLGGPPPDRLNELETRYADQVHIYPSAATFAFLLNTQVPPFNDLRVRQAVNYAVDRRRAAQLSGQAQPTCQILPPDTAGYHPFCPYTIDPNPNGTWTAPDMAKAEQLLRDAHALGARVTVWGSPALQSHVPVTQYYVGLLRRLGFRVSLKSVKDPLTYFTDISEAKYHVQTAFYGWIADYPAASDFLDLLFNCSQRQPDSPNNTNAAEFCDPAIDRMMARAVQLQGTDPYAAGLQWAKVDRAVVLQAPWAPVTTPTGIDLVSHRVKNYQHNPQWGLLVDQLWVR
jgi:YVTN family beta-propeller protein